MANFRLFSALLSFAFFLLFSKNGNAQGFAWGIKGGPTLGQQKWDNSLDRKILFKYHGVLYIESLDETSQSFSLFASVGYHVKGSAVRYYYTTTQGGYGGKFKREFKFQNLSLTVGGKKKQPFGPNLTSYYLIGIRGEYSFKNNLNAIRDAAYDCERLYLPYDNAGSVKKIIGGATLGAGLEFHFSELVGGIIEVTLQPDFTRQYYQPPQSNLINTCSWNNQPGTSVSVAEREIRNSAIEISVGFRFLRKVEYVD
jgi:hypothetical protein